MTTDDLACDLMPARAGDGAAVARLLTMIQRPTTLPLTVWSSPLAGRFVEDVIQGSEPALGMRFYTIKVEGQIEGAICLRFTDGRVFVDNIYVSPRLRRQQMTAYFLRESILLYLREFEAPEAAWDVWAHERALIAWHKQHGGVEQYRKSWFSISLPESGGAASLVQGLEDAHDRHRRYGFSSIKVVTNRGSYTVGMLASHAFRVTDASSINDPEFLPALASIDGKRAVLVYSESTGIPEGASVIASAIRMHAPMKPLFANLEKHIPTKGFAR
jgi:hypothetical protein